jgi:hypothetical protein
VDIKHDASLTPTNLPSVKEQIVSIVFGENGPPFRISLNRQTKCLNPLPYSVLFVVIARFQYSTSDHWPKGVEFTEKCSALWKEIDPKRYRESSRDPEKIWAGWIDQTRKELRKVFPSVCEYDLLPDGKKARRDGLCPRLSLNCVITGVDRPIWSSSRVTTAA